VISTRADLIEAMSDYCGDVDMTKDRKTIGVVGYGYTRAGGRRKSRDLN